MRRLAIALCAAQAACATIGWRSWPSTHTDSYDRAVEIEVRSKPDGATIVDEHGRVVGTAPLALATTHRIERTYRSRSGRGIVVGCLADVALSGLALAKWAGDASTTVDNGTPFPELRTDIVSSNQQRVLLFGGASLLIDCLTVAINVGMQGGKQRRERDSLQVQPRPYDRESIRERVVPRAVAIEARWVDWSPVRTTVTVPDDVAVVLRRGHAGTFDDALVRRARAGATLGPAGLYRTGRAYATMARETRSAAHARLAVDYLERALASGEPRDDVRALIDEMRALVGRP